MWGGGGLDIKETYSIREREKHMCGSVCCKNLSLGTMARKEIESERSLSSDLSNSLSQQMFDYYVGSRPLSPFIGG